MKKLIEALHVIQDECLSHNECDDCPLYNKGCQVNKHPDTWTINDAPQKALL